ncbi:MAG: DUF4290 domain-containing protein [Cytophagales bacterium]|nr:DUF4290 domain-containing protein [Cytophagales bacterium]MDW8383418.1 DUF4290 domain-containing protein [Flammeovirgaceae bacterium]
MRKSESPEIYHGNPKESHQMELNTQRPPLTLKEYGRNIQNLVRYIASLPDKEKRTELAHTLLHLMKIINPAIKENHDNPQRIWDHLYIMSDFELDIDGPYPKPDRSIINQRPMKMEYPQQEIKMRYYGKNIENLIDKAVTIEDEENRKAVLAYIARTMKVFYATWNNKDHTDDATILNHLKILVNGRVEVPDDLLADSQETRLEAKERNHNHAGVHTPRQENGSNNKRHKKKKKKKNHGNR